MPPWSDPIQLALGEYEEQLAKVQSVEELQMWLKLVNAPGLEEFEPPRLWEALTRRRAGDVQVTDLKREEWAAFATDKHHIDQKAEFQIRPAAVPKQVAHFVENVTQVLRLREVRALRGFTRIDPVPDIGDLGEVEALQLGLASIGRTKKNWLPGIDLRGEGVFLRINEQVVGAWEHRPAIQQMANVHAEAQKAWYRERDMAEPAPRPMRYVLLHTLAHVVMRQFSLDCGYASSSLRERIYCDAGADPMAGILIYTASPDSEGSLGGLIEMSRPELLGPLLERALHESRLCANDPLCADREVSKTGTQLNGAACHSCLLEPETSCETGNNYLDRGVLAGTLRMSGAAFVSP